MVLDHTEFSQENHCTQMCKSERRQFSYYSCSREDAYLSLDVLREAVNPFADIWAQCLLHRLRIHSQIIYSSGSWQLWYFSLNSQIPRNLCFKRRHRRILVHTIHSCSMLLQEHLQRVSEGKIRWIAISNIQTLPSYNVQEQQWIIYFESKQQQKCNSNMFHHNFLKQPDSACHAKTDMKTHENRNAYACPQTLFKLYRQQRHIMIDDHKFNFGLISADCKYTTDL